MAKDKTVEVHYVFTRYITCAEADIPTRIEASRKRFQRELQLATHDNNLTLRASRGIMDDEAEGADG